MPAGKVISTTPGQRRPGALRLGGDGQRVDRAADDEVPNVIRDTVSQATTALQEAGLSVSGVSGNPNNKVTGTQPSIGSTVPTGSSSSSSPSSRAAGGAPVRPDLRPLRGGAPLGVAPRGRRVLGGRLRGVRRAHGGVEAARPDAARRRPRAHAGPADPGGRRPLRRRRVVGRPRHAPDPQPLPRPRARPELVVPPARCADRRVRRAGLRRRKFGHR